MCVGAFGKKKKISNNNPKKGKIQKERLFLKIPHGETKT
jgi:hypothetical protein